MTAGDTAHAVQTPITNGVRTVNFFNGRLLTASDLRREQDANAVLRDRIGLAAGDGVVSGLRVGLPPAHPAPDPVHPVVRVTAGVAVNRAGHALRLSYDVDVSLEHPAGTGLSAAPAAPGGFAACSGLPDGAPLATSGVYLLTVAPCTQAQGRAPVGGLGNEIAPCGTDADAEGVQFRIVMVNLPAAMLADPRLRNRLAHLMFGTEDDAAHRFELDPFGGPAQPYGLLDQLRATALVDQEVPLACLLWVPGQGILFVDEWCVRRPVAVRGEDSDWPELTSPRRRLEGQAAFQQFQAELAGLAAGAAGTPTALRAQDRFYRLPAAGLIPLASSRFPRGFDLIRFFDGMATRPATAGEDPAYLDGARLEALLQQSFSGRAIDPRADEFVWTYLVRQNIAQAQAGNTVQTSVLFASGFLPYAGDAQYDLSRFDFANYALNLT
jgi:hypothetical protein